MPGVLFLHETHLVAGYHEDAFEAAFRDGWMPTLAEDDDARLLWYCNLAHGATWSYRVVTVTAFFFSDTSAPDINPLYLRDLLQFLRSVPSMHRPVASRRSSPSPASSGSRSANCLQLTMRPRFHACRTEHMFVCVSWHRVGTHSSHSRADSFSAPP